MTKIEKIIQERKLKPSDCAYHTWRDLSNKKGAYTGKVRILVIKGESNARVEYKCPECVFDGYIEAEWFKPFSFKCEKCGNMVKILKLREEFKRDQKKAKKAEENAKAGKK
jgi:predicted RNA-binding Zn-ribbon protein involved in translation (DUF1610 family)